MIIMVGDLTKNEEMVLRGWIQYPDASGRELADILELNESSVSVAKRRLIDRGLFRRVVVPDFQNLGFELLTSGYGRIGWSSEPNTNITGLTDLLFCAVDRDRTLTIFVSENYTSTMDSVNRFEREHFAEDPAAAATFNYLHFSLVSDKIYNMFDYSYIFGLDKPPHEDLAPEAHIGKAEMDVADLGKREWQVLMGLISNPGATDIALAEEVDMRRHTVARHRRTLEETGLIKKLVVPPLKEIGYEVMVATHCKFKPGSTLETREDMIEWIRVNAPHIFLAASDRESFMVSVYKSFHEAKEMVRRIHTMHKNSGELKGDSMVEYFSIPSTQFVKNVECKPPLRQITREVL